MVMHMEKFIKLVKLLLITALYDYVFWIVTLLFLQQHTGIFITAIITVFFTLIYFNKKLYKIEIRGVHGLVSNLICIILVITVIKNMCFNIPFNQNLWKSNVYTRKLMISHLFEKEIINSLTKEQVVRLLGEPQVDKTNTTGNYIVYSLGEVYFDDDTFNLWIYFKKDGNVGVYGTSIKMPLSELTIEQKKKLSE